MKFCYMFYNLVLRCFDNFNIYAWMVTGIQRCTVNFEDVLNHTEEAVDS